MSITKKTLKSLGKTINNSGYIKDIESGLLVKSIYGKKIKPKNVIGFVKGEFITDLGDLTVLTYKLKYKS
jgi:hypothetical protein